jgi:transposase
MSREGIRGMLHRMDLSYTRSTYSLVKANPQQQEQLEQNLDILKKTS